jgi:hypothetical protein
LVRYCEEEELTFTRSRPYKRNDQCFVEQKNGHVVRRYVGYDRYEGLEAARILGELHAVLRLWINFFQPSMRLRSKTRQGAKLHRVFDEAMTPYDRVLKADEVSPSAKSGLRDEYRELDPVALLAEIARLQDELWPLAYRELPSRHIDPDREATERARIQGAYPPPPASPEPLPAEDRDYRQVDKPRRKHKPHKPHKPCDHWWRTWPDSFETVWAECEAELRVKPNLAATVLLQRLQTRYPGQYDDSKLRTLQRRVRAWRIAQMNVPLPRRPHFVGVPALDAVELSVPYPNTAAA